MVASVVAGGCAATANQVIVVRECLALFYGTELTIGLVLFFWLVWTGLGSFVGGRVSSRAGTGRPASRRLLFVLISLYGLFLPLTVLWIRASRILYGLRPGELVPFERMVLVTGLVTAPVCLLFGVFFGTAWALDVSDQRTPHGKPSFRLYAFECLGATLGGVWLYVFLSFGGPLLHGAVLLAALVTALGVWGLVHDALHGHKAWRFLLVVAAACVVWALGLFENSSRRWQWGPQLVSVRDTLYRNVALLKDAFQESIMADGSWLFSYPDPQSAEEAVHLAMLQHEQPEHVLVLGAVSPENLDHMCRYDSVRRIDVVDPDMTVHLFTRLRHNRAQKGLGEKEDRFLKDLWADEGKWSCFSVGKPVRVAFLAADGRRYAETTDHRYDVVFLQVGDPVCLGANRFFTHEFFRTLTRRLRPGGMVSLHFSGAEDMLGKAQATYFRVMFQTFHSVFPHLVFYPGDRMHLVGSLDGRALTEDPGLLSQRAEERRLTLTYLRPERLENLLNPLRLAYFRSLATHEESLRWNQDLDPVGFFAASSMWATQFHPGVNAFVEPLLRSTLPLKAGFFGLCGMMVLLGVVLLWCRSVLTWSVALTVGSMGATQMAFQVLLLFLYQIAAGALYVHVTVLITACMAGLAAGAFAVHRGGTARITPLWAVRGFLGVHVLSALLVGGVFPWMLDDFLNFVRLWPVWSVLPVFAVIGFSVGAAGGAHFALGCLVTEKTVAEKAPVGGLLYGADMIGAAAAAVLTPLVLVPAFGVRSVFQLYGIFLILVFGISWMNLRRV